MFIGSVLDRAIAGVSGVRSGLTLWGCLAKESLSVDDPKRDDDAVSRNKQDRRYDERKKPLHGSLQHRQIPSDNDQQADAHDKKILTSKG
jgi:hypothetical protein